MSTEPATIEGSVRADPLSYPTPTTARVVVLLVALLGGGLFLGWWTGNAIHGAEWTARIQACGPVGPGTTDAIARCQAGPQGERAVFALYGALAMVVCGVGVLVLLPALVTRRRHLRPMPTAMQATSARVRELADEAGVRSPTVMVGPSTQREAFCYGLPGRYRVVLPLKAALRPTDTALFDPLMRHELAHLRHRDVLAAWLARSVWYTYLPLALVPIVVSVAHEDTSVVVDYVWRAVILLAIVRLVTNAILRSREHDADLAAARGPEHRARLVALLSTSPAVDDAPPSWWRVLRAQHPTIRRRLDVLADPGLAVRATPLDAFTSALLVATVTPVATSVSLVGMASLSVDVANALVVMSLVVGVPLGAAVGLGLWRSDVYGRLSGSRPVVGPVAWSVGAGLALGSFLSPAVSNALGVWSVLITVLVGVGATTVVAGVGRLWSDAAPRVRTVRTHWVAALTVSAVVFGSALASSTLLTEGAGSENWSVFLTAQLTTPLSWLYCVALLVVSILTAIGLHLRRHGLVAPPWVVVEDGSAPEWPVPPGPSLRGALACGAAAGAAVALTLVAIEQLVPIDPRADPQAWVDRATMGPASAGLAGVAAVAALAVVARLRGAGAAVASSVVAVVVASVIGEVTASLGLRVGGLWEFAVYDTRVAAATVVALGPPVAALALLPRRPVRGSRTTTAVLVATGLAILTSATLVLAGPAGLHEYDRLASGRLAVEQYRQEVTVPVDRQLQKVAALVGSFEPQPDDVFARGIRDQILPLLDEASSTAGSAQSTGSTPQLHQRLLDSLGNMRDAYAAIADALDAGDKDAFAGAIDDLKTAAQDYAAWAQDVQADAG